MLDHPDCSSTPSSLCLYLVFHNSFCNLLITLPANYNQLSNCCRTISDSFSKLNVNFKMRRYTIIGIGQTVINQMLLMGLIVYCRTGKFGAHLNSANLATAGLHNLPIFWLICLMSSHQKSLNIKHD